MPRLPDATSLGGLPSANSGRVVSTVDTSAIGRGQQALAKGINDLGQGISSGIESYENRTGGIEESRAKSQYLIERIKLDEERDNETDPAKLNAYGDRYKKLGDDYANRISDPRRRENFLTTIGPDAERSAVTARKLAFDHTRDQELAAADTEATELRTRGLAAKDEETRASVIQAYNDRVDRLRDAGYLKDQEAVARKQKWAQNYAWDSFSMLSPQQRLNASYAANARQSVQNMANAPEVKAAIISAAAELGTTPADLATVISYETGGTFNPAIRGGAGNRHIGLIQFGEEEQKTYGANQGQSFTQQMKSVVSYLKDRGFKPGMGLLDLYSTINAGRPGLHNASDAGNGGAPGTVRDKVERQMGSHRQIASALVGDEGTKFAQAEGERMYKFLPPDIQSKAREQAEADLDRETRENQRIARAQSSDVQNSIADDLASIEGKGVELKGLTRDRVSSVLGEEAANSWEAERVRARKIHSALDGIDALPEGEVEQRLKALEPVAGSSGYVDDMKAYEKARKKADRFLEARRSDPALAVDSFETVRNARASAEYEGDGDRRTIAPASAQAIVRARLAAQKQLGIAEPMAATRSEARAIARQLRYIGEENPQGMERFMRQLEATYGDLADEVLTSSLQLENVNRDLAVLATDVIGKVAKGNMPSIARARQYEIAAENQTISSAMDGSVPQPAQPQPPSSADRIDTYRQGIERQEAMRRNAGNKKPGEPEAVTYDAEDIRWLDQNRANPEAAMNFDLKYGPKASQRILAEVDRRKGVKR